MALFIGHNGLGLREQAVAAAEPAAALKVALINNMPDTALEATERQFSRCLAAASGDRAVVLSIYALPSIARGPIGATYTQTRCSDYRTLFDEPCDGIIISGTEPLSADLSGEPYWGELTAMFDWAADYTSGIFLSCLSAHAWLLHRDGVRRRRMATKRSGLFEHDLVGANADAFACGLPLRAYLPHSRWNDLDGRELQGAGYTLIYESPTAGVGVFIRRAGPLLLLCQGHPEYDPASLVKEYRRDVARYLRGESPVYPVAPAGLFNADTECRLERFRSEAIVDPGEHRLAMLPLLSPEFPPDAAWETLAGQLFARWLDHIGQARSQSVLPIRANGEPLQLDGLLS
jgi:homoserine O-succinyltransferase/O-acetyltransferase